MKSMITPLKCWLWIPLLWALSALGGNADVESLTPQLTLMDPLTAKKLYFGENYLSVPPIPFHHVYDVVRTPADAIKYDGTPLANTIDRILSTGSAAIVTGPQDEFRAYDNPQHPKLEELEVHSWESFENHFGKLHLSSQIEYFKSVDAEPDPRLTGSVRLGCNTQHHFLSKSTTPEGGERPLLVLVLDSIPYDNYATLKAYAHNDEAGNPQGLVHRGVHRRIKSKSKIEREGEIAFHVQFVQLDKLSETQREHLLTHLDNQTLNSLPKEYFSRPHTLSDTELFALHALGHGKRPAYRIAQHLRGLKDWYQHFLDRLSNTAVRPRDLSLASPGVWVRAGLVSLLTAAYTYSHPAETIHNTSEAFFATFSAGLFGLTEAVMYVMFTTTTQSFFSKPNTVLYTYVSTYARSVVYGVILKSLQYMDPVHVLSSPEILTHIMTHSLVAVAARFYFRRLNKEMREVALRNHAHKINVITQRSIQGYNRRVLGLQSFAENRWGPKSGLSRFFNTLTISDNADHRVTQRSIPHDVAYDMVKLADLILGDMFPAGHALKLIPRAVLVSMALVSGFMYHSLKLMTDPSPRGLESRLNPARHRALSVFMISLGNAHRVAWHFVTDVLYRDVILKSGRGMAQRIFPAWVGIRCTKKLDQN